MAVVGLKGGLVGNGSKRGSPQLDQPPLMSIISDGLGLPLQPPERQAVGFEEPFGLFQNLGVVCIEPILFDEREELLVN